MITTPKPLVDPMVEPLALDRTCPIPETDAMTARKIPIRLLAIGEASYTCEGPLDPHMPPVTWTRENVDPLLMEDLRRWADAKMGRIERESEEKVQAVADRVKIRAVEDARGYFEIHIDATTSPGEPNALIPSERRQIIDAIQEATRVRRFLVTLALPQIGKRHVDRVLQAMANADLREFAAFAV